MSRIDEALDRYEAAASKSGLVLGHGRENIHHAGIPFNSEKNLPELDRLGIRLPDDYFTYLRRWNGLNVISGTDVPRPTLDIAISIRPSSIETSLRYYNRETSAVGLNKYGEPKLEPEEYFFRIALGSTIHGDCGRFNYLELFFARHGGGDLILRSQLFGRFADAGFESFANLIECCAESLENGIPTILTADSLREDWEFRIAFWEICRKKNPFFRIWNEEIEMLKEFRDNAEY